MSYILESRLLYCLRIWEQPILLNFMVSNPLFAISTFSAALSHLQSAGDISYVLRHHFSTSGNGVLGGLDTPSYLSGYGVDLALKSIEYKAIDDSAINQNSEDGLETYVACVYNVRS